MKLKKLSLCLMVLLVLYVSGCAEGKKLPPKVEGNLKILLTNMEPAVFNNNYKNAFLTAYPDVKVHLIYTDLPPFAPESDILRALNAKIEEENPDIVVDNKRYFGSLLADDFLMPLDEMIRINGFPLDDLHAGVVAGLRNLGEDGMLYALGPTFTNEALLINRSIFQKQNVVPPTEQLTWDEAFDMAEDLYGDNKPALVTSWSPFYLAYIIAGRNGLNDWNESGKIVMLDNDERRQIWEKVIQLYNRGVIASDEGQDLFGKGLAAMTIGYSTYSAILGNKLDWDVISRPSGTADSGGGTADQLFAMFANARNKETAWAFLAFLHGDEYAKGIDIRTGIFPTRTTSITYSGDKNLRAFFEPGAQASQAGRSQFPQYPVEEAVWLEGGYIGAFYSAISTEFDAALQGAKSVAEALIDAQLNAQKVLDEAHEAASSK